MPPKHHDQTEAAEALSAVAPLATRWIERLLAQHEPPLTVPQYLALRAIVREGVSGTELAKRSGVSGPAVSQLIAALADGGLVERRPAESDRRRIELTLSKTGQRAYEHAESLLGSELGSLLADLPKPERDALARLLPRVEAALSGAPPPRRPKLSPHHPLVRRQGEGKLP